jgi:hypothetical protein
MRKLYKILRLFWTPKCVNCNNESESFDTKGHFYLITTLNSNKAVNWQEYLGSDYEQAMEDVRKRKERENSEYWLFLHSRSVHHQGVYSFRVVRFDEKLEPLPFDGLSEKFFKIGPMLWMRRVEII